MRGILGIIARLGVAAFIAATLCAAGLLLYARSQGLLILSVQTGSMRPYIRPGDAVLVRQTPGTLDQLQQGDIINFRSHENPDVLITHRVVSVDYNRQLITARGDALDRDDPVITADRLVGRVERIVPLAGYGFDVFRHPAGLAAAVYMPSLALVAWEVRRLMVYYAAQRYSIYYY